MPASRDGQDNADTLILPLFHDLSQAEQDMIVEVVTSVLTATAPVIGDFL